MLCSNLVILRWLLDRNVGIHVAWEMIVSLLWIWSFKMESWTLEGSDKGFILTLLMPTQKQLVGTSWQAEGRVRQPSGFLQKFKQNLRAMSQLLKDISAFPLGNGELHTNDFAGSILNLFWSCCSVFSLHDCTDLYSHTLTRGAQKSAPTRFPKVILLMFLHFQIFSIDVSRTGLIYLMIWCSTR